jgi:hypothetical protein
MNTVIDFSLTSIRLRQDPRSIFTSPICPEPYKINSSRISGLNKAEKLKETLSAPALDSHGTIIKVLSKTYISPHIKLEFSNHANLKNDIQNRITSTTPNDFITALNEIKGDNKNNYGFSFSECTLQAMAYFYSDIFTSGIRNEFYTLEMVKGFLDGNNLTSYTAIHEIDVEYRTLKDATYFKHCWLIIQSAWFFNSAHFGQNQHIDYVNYYIQTGKKLPIQEYNNDRKYLDKKYRDVDNRKHKGIPINGFTLVNQWYTGILFLVCKELKLSTENFNISRKDNREYNPLPKTSRQLRSLAPFKLIECDIKSAFPTFLDIETGANLKDHIYSNLMKSKGITRGDAKILFNTVCNSGKYKSKQETATFFIDCGYTTQQSEILIDMTHNRNAAFISFMTEQESNAIKQFILLNDLQRGVRLHDAVLFIDDKTKPLNMSIKPNCDFELKEMNSLIIRESFLMGTKHLDYAYINAIPKGLDLISKHEFTKGELKGEANGFRFYKSKFEYISASFNINDYTADYKSFKANCNLMLNTLLYLNKNTLKSSQLLLILEHIRMNSNNIFNVRAMHSSLEKEFFEENIMLKKRNYNLTDNLKYRTRKQFTDALHQAEKMVNVSNNYKELFDLLNERIKNDDYRYIDEVKFTGHKDANLLSYAMVRKFNILVTGRIRKKRNGVKSEDLYNSSVKNLTTKCFSLKPQIQNAFMKKGITRYEKQLLAFNKLIRNREKAKQLFLLLSKISGLEHELEINEDNEIQDILKAELMASINRADIVEYEAGATKFDSLYKPLKKYDNPVISNLEDIFDPNMSNSIFNQVDMYEAYDRGLTFFYDYMRFPGISGQKTPVFNVIKPAEKYKLPEIDFDER